MLLFDILSPGIKSTWINSNADAVLEILPDAVTLDTRTTDKHCSVILDVAFSDDKDYVFECEVRLEYEVEGEAKPEEESFAGILFFAEDALNGYGLLINCANEIQLGSMEDGQMLDLRFGHYKSNSSGIIKLRFESSGVLWKCFVQDQLAYATNARFHMGNKGGLYCAPGMMMTVTQFRILESDQILNCVLPFSESAFHRAILHIIEAAPDDFTSIEGAFSHTSGDIDYWEVKNIQLPGVLDLYLQRGGITQEHRIGRNFMMSFGCEPYADRLRGLELFTRIVNMVDALKPTSGTMHYLGTREDLSPTFLKSVAYENEITHASLGIVTVIVQMDFTVMEGGFYTFIQINARNGP